MIDISDFPKWWGSNYSDKSPVFPVTATGFDI
jgi:hypothetical protein